MSRTKPKDFDSDPPPGWSAPREVKDERPIPTLNSEGAIGSWAAKAASRSGPAYSPGVGVRKSS